VRVLHINNIVNVPWIFSRVQRKMGFQSDVLVLSESSYGFRGDIMISKNSKLSRILFPKFLRKFVSDYDLYHFHCNSLLPRFMDISVWKSLGKKVIVHYHGSDVRGKKKHLPRWFADRIFVSTPDLLEYVPKAVWIPNPVDLENLPFVGCQKKMRSTKIVHATTSWAIKGTDRIVKAINELKREGYDIEFILIEDMPHVDAIEYYKQADIAVDQLKTGWYGMFAIECMALGKPVCVYIRKDLESFLPFMPVLNTSPKNVVENLRLLVEDAKTRIQLGKKGREYVEKMHDSYKSTERLAKSYGSRDCPLS